MLDGQRLRLTLALSLLVSLEIALMASGEDDVLSYVFQKMVAALRDGAIRDMKCVPPFEVLLERRVCADMSCT